MNHSNRQACLLCTQLEIDMSCSLHWISNHQDGNRLRLSLRKECFWALNSRPHDALNRPYQRFQLRQFMFRPQCSIGFIESDIGIFCNFNRFEGHGFDLSRPNSNERKAGRVAILHPQTSYLRWFSENHASFEGAECSDVALD